MAKSPFFIVTGMSSCQRPLTETIWQLSNNELVRSRTCLRNPAFKLRAEIVERSFAHSLDRGGMCELGGAGARTCTSGTCFMSPATISHC